MPPLLLFACACGGAGPADDRPAYADLLAATDLATGTRIDACLRLSDPDLAGDCALVAAEASPARGEGHVEAWCVRLPGGAWQDECWFRAAERALVVDRDPDLSARLCAKAGPFTPSCAAHLWQLRLKPLFGRDGPEAFQAHQADAEDLLVSWMPEASREPAVEEGFWEQYYEIGFESAPRVLPSACAPLEPQHRTRCEAAAASVWSGRLATILQRDEALSPFCARTAQAATVAALLAKRADVPPVPGRIDTEPGPTLDAVVADVRAKRCTTP